MSQSNQSKIQHSCSSCNAMMQRQGATSCGGAPGNKPPQPAYCPSELYAEIIDESFQRYCGSDDEARLARAAAKVEGLCYQSIPGSDAVNAHWTRVEDMIALARLMDYKKIGIATCVGLLDECEKLCNILRAQGMEPYSACCKAGSIDKLKLNLCEDDKVRPGTFEAACNPIAQARILNAEGMQMNIIVGLCVGHDMLFNKYSEAPVTTLVVKDRVTGHNPVAILYGQNHYYKRLQKQPVISDEDVARHREELDK